MPDQQVETYRISSAKLAGAGAAVVAQSMPNMIDFADLLGSFGSWLEFITPVVSSSGQRNSELSKRYYSLLRASEGFTTPAPRWQPQPVVPEALRRSMYATAGQALQDVERFKVEPQVALKKARVAAAGVAIRYSMNAGRNAVIATAKADPEAIGCVYVTRNDRKTCPWCLLLSSRGPVYKGNSFAESDAQFVGGGTAKSHDNCRCILVPIGNLDSSRLEVSKGLWEHWKAVNYENGRIKNSGKAAVSAWRRYVKENRERLIQLSA